MLKEARIIMPHDSSLNAGRVHARMAEQLNDAFGGHTRFAGYGGRIDDAGEPGADRVVLIYDVAVDADRDAEYDKLFQIAHAAGEQLDQKAVYIRYPDGFVEIAECSLATCRTGHRPIVVETGGGVATGARPGKVDHKPYPQIGDIWKAADGALVAVTNNGSAGRLGCTALTGRDIGQRFIVSTAGRFVRIHEFEPHPLDLVERHGSFL